MALAMIAGAAPAAARTEARPAIVQYVEARAAADNGSIESATRGYNAALAAAPANELVAAQALAYAVPAGQWPLALRAARMLEARNALPEDGRFLLIADAMRGREWRAAAAQIDKVESEQLFAFAVPAMRAWMAHGSGQGDPIALLNAAGRQGPAAAYAAEQRPLLLAALGRAEEAAEMLATPPDGARAMRLRIAAANTLAARGQRAAGIALLTGEAAPIVAARARLQSGGRPAGTVTTAAEGLSEILIRIALDLHQQEMGGLATGFARVATLAAPGNNEAAMVTAELLASQNRGPEAITLLGTIEGDDPIAAQARDRRIRLMVEGGQAEAALREAQASAAAAPGDVTAQVRLGDILVQRDRPAEAAEAYNRAIAARGDGEGPYPMWALLLFAGGAHDAADQWPQARAALERARSLAPDQPLILNYLGYAQLVRRENMAEAEALVREAHRLAPDNAAITDSLGWALYLKGNLAEAIPLLEQAAQGEPADVEINEHLGDAYYAAGRRADARFAWTAARVHAEGEAAERLRAKIETGLTPQLAAR